MPFFNWAYSKEFKSTPKEEIINFLSLEIENLANTAADENSIKEILEAIKSGDTELAFKLMGELRKPYNTASYTPLVWLLRLPNRLKEDQGGDFYNAADNCIFCICKGFSGLKYKKVLLDKEVVDDIIIEEFTRSVTAHNAINNGSNMKYKAEELPPAAAEWKEYWSAATRIEESFQKYISNKGKA